MGWQDFQSKTFTGIAELIIGYDTAQKFSQEQRFFSSAPTRDDVQRHLSRVEEFRFMLDYKFMVPCLSCLLLFEGETHHSPASAAAGVAVYLAGQAIANGYERSKLKRRLDLQKRILSVAKQSKISPETLHSLAVQAGPLEDIAAAEKGIAYSEGASVVQYHLVDN